MIATSCVEGDMGAREGRTSCGAGWFQASIRGLVMAVVAITVPLSLAQTKVVGFDEPMRFHDIGSACQGTATFCGPYLLARGQITADTPQAFERAIRDRKFGKDIKFDSPGGNLRAALELGRLIRRHGYNTGVGGPYTEVVEVFKNEKTLVDTGRCFSACAYAFFGGVGRVVDEDGQLGLHQLSGVNGQLREGDVQVVMALLGQYVDEMGLDRRILDIAAMVPPERMHIITRKVATGLLIDNTSPPLRPWELKSTPTGTLYMEVVQPVPARDATTGIRLRVVKGHLAVSALFGIKQSFRTLQDMERIFSGDADVRLVVDGEAVEPRHSFPWKSRQERGFVANAVFRGDVIQRLANAKSVEIRFNGVHPAHFDVNPAVNLSTTGLPEGLAAIMKAGESVK